MIAGRCSDVLGAPPRKVWSCEGPAFLSWDGSTNHRSLRHTIHYTVLSSSFSNEQPLHIYYYLCNSWCMDSANSAG